MILNIKPDYRVASQLKKLVNVGGGGLEAEEIKLAGVRVVRFFWVTKRSFFLLRG